MYNWKLWIFVFLFFSSACSNNGKLKIAAASNVAPTIKEIAQQFEEKYQIGVDVIPGSSGKLSAQIKQGAPFDIFVSADLLYPTDLTDTGNTLGQPEVYAYGELVIYTNKKGLAPKIESFSSSEVEKIAIANPETAPYGRYSQSVLNHYNLEDILSEKMVYGESLAQTTQFIQTGAADIGITGLSLVKNQKIGQYEKVSNEAYLPIAQAVVKLNRSRHESADLFYDFLFSTDVEAIFESFGYSINPEF